MPTALSSSCSGARGFCTSATAVFYAERGFHTPLARGLFCLSRASRILSHAWKFTGQGTRNNGPTPREYLWP